MTFRTFQAERKRSNSFVPRRLSFSLHLELGRDRKKKTREIQNSLSLPSLLQTRQGEKRGPGNEVRNISFPCRRRQVISPHVAACGIDCLLVWVKAEYEKKHVSRPDFYLKKEAGGRLFFIIYYLLLQAFFTHYYLSPGISWSC